MEGYKKQATFIFNNYFQLKRSLHGNKDRRRMLVKLRKDLRKLGLSKRARRAGLMQLAVRPCVVLERLPVSSYKEKSLQSLHNNNKNFMTSYKESQYEHRDDAQKRRIEDSQDLHQQSNIQILNAAAETASINILDASKTCRNEEQGCNLLEKELSKPREKIINLIQDFTQKATKKNSHIDVTSTKHMDVSEKLDIKAACSLSSSKDELLKKQNFTHKFANKNSRSESKINFSKDRSISVPAKKMNIFVNEECSSENESSDTTVPLRLTKHRSDPKRSINSSEDANVFARQHKKNISSLKTKLDTLQECSNESRIVNISSECNISSSNIISEATANDFTNENENVQLDLELVKHIDTSLQYKGIKKNIRQTKINLKSKNLSTVNLHIGTNSKVVIKRKVSSRNSDQNALPIKIRKKNEINTSPDKVVPHSNIEIFKYKLDHTNQRIRGNIIRYKKRENYKSRKRKKDKYKTKREKLQKYFERSFDSNTSETEENNEILLNYRKGRKQESDDLLHDDKKLTHDTNLQKNIESINFNNSYDFTTNFEKCATHDATTDTEIEDEASIDKRVTLANNKQENVESDNSDNSCDSTACTEKYYAIYNAADEVGEASTRENETSVNNSQENTEDISSDNLCDSSASTEEDCAIKDAATKIEAKDGALVCTYDTSSTNSQKNIDIVIFLDKVKSDDSCDSTVTEKYFMHDATIDEKIEGRPGKHGTCANNSQINIEDAQSVKENCNNSCDFTASSEECYTTFDEYATDEIEDRRASIRKRDTFANNFQKNITESTILAKTKSDNSCNCTINTEKNYATPDTTTEKKIVEPSIAEASICIRDMSANNSQKSIENAESIKKNSDSSCDSTTNIEIHSMHDTATDEKVENRASKYISSTSANDSEENKRNAIPVKKQCVENFLSIVATENNSKSDTRAEQGKDNDLSTIEMGLDENTSDMENRNIEKQADMTCMPILQNQQENQEICNSDSVDLTQDTRRRAISNLELPIAFANDSALCNVNEKDSRGMSQNIKNLLKSNDILKDGKTSLDQFSVTTSEKNSLERRHDESSFVQTTNSSTSLSQSNCNDNHSSDDDNSNNIEVEIKIKPKLKSQISQKFSLKASSSAVNSYIENLYTLKNNPNFLNEIFEINHKSSERSKQTITSKRPENNMSLSDNQNITAETEEIVYDSVFTVKDNAKCSQQQNFQDSPILKEDENAMDSNQRERNKCMQPVKTTTQITTENNSVSSELACGTSNLEKQIHDASTGDKRKINEEQHSQDNTITKKIKSERVHNQQKEDKNASFIERKKIQIADNPEGIKTAYNMPDLGQQLPQTFLDVTHSKVRSITEINCQCAMKFSSLNASNIRKCVCLKICQSAHSKSVSSQSTSHRSESLQLTSQSTPTQSTPHPSVSSQVTPTQSALSISSQLPSSQSALPLLILSQLAPTQSVPCASVPVQLAPTQSTLRPSVPFQVAPPLLILSQLAPTQSAPRPSLSFQVAPIQSAPRPSVSFQLAPTQSVSCPLVFSQLSSAQSAPTPSTLRSSISPHLTSQPTSVPPQLISQSTSDPSVSLQSTHPQLTSRLISKLPSYDTAIKQIYFSSRTNAPVTPVAPVEINTPNVNNERTNYNYTFQIIMKSLNDHIKYCRNFIRHTRIRHVTIELTEKMYVHVKQIDLILAKLKILLCTKDTQDILTYINQCTSLNPSLSLDELNMYSNIVETRTTLISQQNANASQYPNVSESVSSASMSNAITQSSFRNAPFPDTENGKSKQSSIIPHPVPTISNINQQQLFGNSANYSQMPHSRQLVPNICRMADISDVGISEASVNTSNVSSRNINMHSCGPVHRGNVNVPPITNMRQSHVAKSTVSSTAIASAANAQQQKQINSRTTICPPLIANQNVGMCKTVHNVTLSGSFTVNLDAPEINTTMRNVKHQSANQVNQINCISQVSQAPLGRTKLLPQYNCPNPNEAHFSLLLQSTTIHKMQNHSIQNILPDQNIQIPQQKLPVNQANANVPSANNRGQSNVALKNIISSTKTAINQHLQPNHSCAIDLSISNTSQNVQQSVNKEIPQSQNKDYVQKTPSINLHKGNLSAHDILQNTSSTAPKTSTSQSSDVFPNTIMFSQHYSDTSNKMSTLPKNTQANDVVYNFNLMNLTDNQISTLYNQIRSYLRMSEEMTNSLNKRQYERIHHEKTTLFYFSQHLRNYIKSKIIKSQTVEKNADEDSQDNTSGSRIILQKNTIQTSVDELTKTQSNQVNENNPVYNKNLKEQSSKQDTDLYILETSKSTAVKSNLAQNKESLFTPDFATRKSLSKYMSSQEQNNNLLRKLLQKKSPIKERPKITENSHETSNVATSNSSTENEAPSQFSCNTKDQNNEIYNDGNEMINKDLNDKLRNDENIAVLNSTEIQSEPLNISPSLKQSSLNNMSDLVSSIEKCKSTEITQRETHAETISKSYLAQQEDPTNEWSDDSDTISSSSFKLYIDESSQNLDECEIPFSQEDNLSISQDSASLINTTKCKSTKLIQGDSEEIHEKQVESIEFCLNAQQEDSTNSSIDESSGSFRELYIDENSKESQNDKQCDEISSSEKDNLSTSQDSASYDTMYESTKIPQVTEKHAETISEFCLDAQQEDFSNEQSNNSIDEVFESSGKLYTDESAKNTKVASTFSKNIPETNSADIRQEFVTETQDTENTEEENSQQSLLKIEEMCLQEMPLIKGESSTREHATELTYLSEDNNDIIEFLEDTKEEKIIIDHDDINMIVKKEEIIDTHGDINLIIEYLEEEKMIKDIHNDNTINEQLQQIYQTSSCNFVQENDPVDVNEKKEISAENNVLNVNTAECTSVENDNDSKVTDIIPSIVSIRSISPSLFEKLDTNIFSENNLEILNKNDEKSMDINDDLEISDVDNVPCLRCKRKSTVYCRACLEAPYCSKRCSSLHWNAVHYKQCKGDNFTCIDLV